jgi:hypothetical protein
MVMFHPEIPYADAKRLSELQDNILETLSENVSTSSQINWDIAEKLIKEYKAIQN